MLDYCRLLLRLKTDRRGVTALEYGLIAGLIAVAIISSVSMLGKTISGQFGSISSAVHQSEEGKPR